MVNVTWIAPFAPDRSGGGGHIRQAHLLLALAARADVELICPGPVKDDGVRAAVSRLVEVELPASEWREDHPWMRRAADLGASLVPSQPMEVRGFRPVRRALRPAVERALRPAPPGADAEVVLVHIPGLAPLLPGWAPGSRRQGRRGRWVLSLDNLPSRMSAHQSLVMPHRRQRWLLDRDAKVAASFERRAAAAFDAVITCTEEDAAALTGSDRVIVVPNGTDIERFGPSPLPSIPRVVFTGALYTTPNIDGARWLCHEVLPLIRLEEPSVELDLVGARPVQEVRALGELAGVTVHADVDAVAPYLEAARMAVVPIRVGSGSRLKALEALAAGRPVVGTSIGLEGLDLRQGEHVLQADGAAAFAAAVVRLLRDDGLAAELAAAGRAEAERRFAWPAIGARFTDSILDLAQDVPAPATGSQATGQPETEPRTGTVPGPGRSR